MSRAKRSNKIKHVISISLMLVIVLAAAYFIIRNNVHSVLPKQVYRSAQLSSGDLGWVIDQYHIRGVLNLRGPQTNKPWYSEELEATRRHGAEHFDLAMGAYRLPKPETLRKLLVLLQRMPKPLLLHCQGGADRSGLASMMTLLLNDAPLEEASRQVSLRYFAYRRDSVGRLVTPYYRCWLRQHKVRSSKAHLLEWAAGANPYQCKAAT